MRVALVVSLLLHVLIVLLFRHTPSLPPSPFAAAGPRANDDQAAMGGGTQIIAIRVEQEAKPAPEVEPDATVIPVPVPTEVVVEVEQPKPRVAAAPALAMLGPVTDVSGIGRATGPGTATGRGSGDGGTGDEGLFRVVPPAPRGLILPPSDRPGKVRGREVDVWVFVTSAGKVVADSTRIAPSTGDRKFDDRLRDQAAEWVFTPAQREGRPVAEWFRYTIIL